MIIVPCGGVCNLGRLAVDAAHIFSRDTSHELFALGAIAAGHAHMDIKADILVVNGCEERCASVVLQKENYIAKWTLTISDLGITKRADRQCNEEDLLLVVDAVEAECSDIGDQVPKELGQCGCC